MFVSSFVLVLCPLVLGLLCWCTARKLVSVFCFVFGTQYNAPVKLVDGDVKSAILLCLVSS